MTSKMSFRTSAIESSSGLSPAFKEMHLEISPTKILIIFPSPYDSPSSDE